MAGAAVQTSIRCPVSTDQDDLGNRKNIIATVTGKKRD